MIDEKLSIILDHNYDKPKCFDRCVLQVTDITVKKYMFSILEPIY